MTPTFDKVHLKFKLNGINYTHESLKVVAYSLIKEGEMYEKAIGDFLLDWLDSKDYVSVKTSGSTGIPKVIRAGKQAMVNSSIITGDFFKLQPGDNALLCLPAHYIAGKMMLVRALILGLELDLVEPTSSPDYDDLKSYSFCAMIPMQLRKSLHRLNNIKILIIGGASVSPDLLNDIKTLNTKVFATYGMTETVSHIALKLLNEHNESSYFKILNDIQISTDSRDCLVINAPKLTSDNIITNDIVKLHSDTEFELLGRYDNIINSGGIKLFPEQIEAKLYNKIASRFFIASEADSILGEQLILIVESDSISLDVSIFNTLHKFEVPKQIYAISEFSETSSGKINRRNTLKMLQ
ncbi:O-succinylbenzoic acid--CoA ligase [Flavobacteriales bacterium 34_180_T64]|nr:O-succinylbenzoic acid--CoA ligase [Flavobacteriales bacterium 34_180_T64]